MKRKTKRFSAILCLVAMFISIMPFNAFAAANGTITASSLATAVKTANTTLNFTIKDGDTAINQIDIDFASSNLVSGLSNGTQITVSGVNLAVAIAGSVATLTKVGGGDIVAANTNYAVSIPVTTPDAATATLPEVTFGDEAKTPIGTAINLVAANATFTYGFKDGAAKTRESASTLTFTVKDADTDFNNITVDFVGGATGMDVTDATVATGYTKAVDTTNDVVTISKNTGVTKEFSFDLAVVNPNDGTFVQPVVKVNGAPVALAAGVADPVVEDYYTITLDPATAVDKESKDIKVTVKRNSTALTETSTYTLTKRNANNTDDIVLSQGSVVNGVVTIPAQKFEAATDASNPTPAEYYYTFKYEGLASNGSDDNNRDSDAQIKVQQDIASLTGVDNVVFGDTRLIQGTVKNAAGTAFAGAVLLKNPAGGTVATANTNSTGGFALNPTFNQAGKWAIYVNGAKYNEIVVAPKAYTLTLSGDVFAKFENKLTVVAKDGSNLANDLQTGDFKILKSDNTEVAIATVTGPTLVNGTGNGTYVITFGDANLALGTYTLKITNDTAGVATEAEYVTTQTFAATSASNFNVSLAQNGAAIGEDTFIGGNETDDLQVKVVNSLNKGILTTDPTLDVDNETTAANTIKEIKVDVTGLGVKESIEVKATDIGLANNTQVVEIDNIIPEQAGDLTVNVAVKYWGGTTASTTKTIAVNGYKVTLDLGDFKFGNIVTPKVTVVDAKGNVINTATVTIGLASAGAKNLFTLAKDADGKYDDVDADDVVSAEANPNNGIYNFKSMKLTDVDDNVLVTVKAGNDIKAQFKKSIEGLGVLTMTANIEKLVAGYEDASNKVTLYPKDEQNNLIQDLQDTNFKVNGKTLDELGYGFKQITDPANSTKEIGYEISGNVAGTKGINPVETVNGVTQLKDQVFTVSVAGGQKSGSKTIKAELPKVTFSLANKVTENIREKLTISIADPRTNDAKNGTIDLVATTDKSVTPNVPTSYVTLYKAATGVNTMDAADLQNKASYDVFVYAEDNIDSKADAKFDVTVNGITVATFDVKAASLTPDVANITLGAENRIVFTLTDAHGNALAGKEIVYASSTLGTTGTDGKIIIPALEPVASGEAVFTAKESATNGGTVLTTKKIAIVEAAPNTKLVGDPITVAEGVWVAVENAGKGKAKAVKVVVKDKETKKEIASRTIAEIAAGDTVNVLILAKLTKTKTETTYKNVIVRYDNKVTSYKNVYTGKKKVAYKVKVNGKTVTKYKYVNQYKKVPVYTKVPVYAKKAETKTTIVPIQVQVELVK